MGHVVVDRLVQALLAQAKSETKKAPKRPDPETQRINREIDNLQIERNTSFPALNIEPLKLLIRQGASIGEIYRSGGLLTVDVSWPNGKTGQVFQEVGASDVLVDNGGRNDAATIEVQRSSRKAKYVVRSASCEQTYSDKGDLTSQTQGREHHVFEEGKRVFSEDLGTGKKYFYFEGTDRVAFIEQPDGAVLKKDIFAFDDNKQFQVELKPTNYMLAQDQKKRIAQLKPRVRRSRKAYRKMIKARVRESDVSGEFDDSPEVHKTTTTGQTVVAAGVALAANPVSAEPLQGIFGLHEGLVVAFLRTGSAFGAPTVVSSKSTVVAGTTESERVSDDAAAVRGVRLVPAVVLSEGAVLAMVSHSDSSDAVHDEPVARTGGRDSAKPSNKMKAAMLQAFHKPEVPTVGAPATMARGAMPTMRGERYIASKSSVRVLDGIRNPGPQSSLFKGTVLSAASGNQYVIPAALPVLMKAAAPVEAKISVKDAMREMLVKKADRGSRDSGSGSNSHKGSDDDQKKKQQQPKQADV